MSRPVTTVIDSDLCTGCGLCVKVCPSETLSLENRTARVTGTESLACDHCAAVCPTGAIRVQALETGTVSFLSFQADDTWLPHGDFDPARLVRLMASRRSCRNFSDRPVSREILEDLVHIGITAPSGTNSQLWTFTILPTRPAVMTLAEKILIFFKKLNKMAEKPYLRQAMKLIGKPELDHYYREFHDSICQGLADWEERGRDRLFHGAPAAVLVGSKPEASCPMEDAMLATQNILLGAHALGLGTCLVGYAVAAMKNDKSLYRALGLPKGEEIYAVIALGWPNEQYQTTTRRLPPTIRYVFE